MSYSQIIEEVENLPRYREFICPNCGKKQRAYTLRIQIHCEECKTRVKLRGYGAIGTEIEDVIDSVLAWMGNDEPLKEALLRKQEMTRGEQQVGRVERVDPDQNLQGSKQNPTS